MNRRAGRWGLCGVWVVFLCWLAPVRMTAQEKTSASPVPTKAVSGIWYEQGRAGVKRERNCVADTVLLISPGNQDDQLLFVRSCKHVKHYTDDWSETIFWKKGTVPKELVPNALRVRTLPLLSRPLQLVALSGAGDAAGWMVLGTPNHRSLWVYSRVPVLSSDALAAARSAAAAQGFDPAKLVRTPQPNR